MISQALSYRRKSYRSICYYSIHGITSTLLYKYFKREFCLEIRIVFSEDGLADLQYDQYRDENYCFSKSDQGLSHNSRLSLCSDVRGSVYIEDDLSLNSKEILLISFV